MHPYFKNPCVSLYYSREEKLGMAEWEGHLRGADFREAMLLCLELMDRFGLKGWLEDDRKVLTVDAADLQWSKGVLTVRLKTIPLLRLARLPSEVAQPTLSDGVKVGVRLDSGSSLALRDFKEKQAALDWLQEIALGIAVM